MNTDKKNENGSEAKANEETATLKLGLDVHAAQITMCRQWEGLGLQSTQKLSWEKALKWIREQAEDVPYANVSGPIQRTGLMGAMRPQIPYRSPQQAIGGTKMALRAQETETIREPNQIVRIFFVDRMTFIAGTPRRRCPKYQVRQRRLWDAVASSARESDGGAPSLPSGTICFCGCGRQGDCVANGVDRLAVSLSLRQSRVAQDQRPPRERQSH